MSSRRYNGDEKFDRDDDYKFDNDDGSAHIPRRISSSPQRPPDFLSTSLYALLHTNHTITYDDDAGGHYYCARPLHIVRAGVAAEFANIPHRQIRDYTDELTRSMERSDDVTQLCAAMRITAEYHDSQNTLGMSLLSVLLSPHRAQQSFIIAALSKLSVLPSHSAERISQQIAHIEVTAIRQSSAQTESDTTSADVSPVPAMMSSVMENLDLAAHDIKANIITLIPLLIHDTRHAVIASHLTALMSSAPKLVNVILDTLSAMTLPPSTSQDTLIAVIKLIPALEMEALIVAIKFMSACSNKQR